VAKAAAGPGPPAAGEWRGALLVAVTTVVWLLPLQHCHFKGSDELAVFEMSRSLLDGRGLAVPPLRHTETGADGRRYSYFSPGQSLLALPLVAAGRAAERVLPEPVQRRIAGPPRSRGAYTFGGTLETSFASAWAPLATAALLFAFFGVQRELGVERRTAAAVTAALGLGTPVALHANYFLRHTSEAAALLGSLWAFLRFSHEGRPGALAAGACLASAMPLLRLPAAVAGPGLAVVAGWAVWRRSDGLRDRARVLRCVAVLLAPLLAAVAVHGLVNRAKWGTWLGSPMVEQAARFEHPVARGLAGLLVSPGSSVFLYAPLLLLAPLCAAALWRRAPALAVSVCVLIASFLGLYAGFDGWSGLWSAPGPRYLLALVPVALAPLGLWLRGERRRWRVAAGLALAGAWVQLACTVVRWGSVPSLAGYPVLSPDQSSFLFEPGRSPVLVMSRLLLGGGPYDAWLLEQWRGWPGTTGSPALVIALLLAWGAAAALLPRRRVECFREARDP